MTYRLISLLVTHVARYPAMQPRNEYLFFFATEDMTPRQAKDYLSCTACERCKNLSDFE